jgi:hypothetical protein
MISRIAKQPLVFRFLNFHRRIGFNQREHGLRGLRRE